MLNGNALENSIPTNAGTLLRLVLRTQPRSKKGADAPWRPARRSQNGSGTNGSVRYGFFIKAFVFGPFLQKCVIEFFSPSGACAVKEACYDIGIKRHQRL